MSLGLNALLCDVPELAQHLSTKVRFYAVFRAVFLTVRRGTLLYDLIKDALKQRQSHLIFGSAMLVFVGCVPSLEGYERMVICF